MAKNSGVFGNNEFLPEPVKELKKNVDFSVDHADKEKTAGFGYHFDVVPDPDDNQLGKGHSKGFAGKVNDNRSDRNRSTNYGAGPTGPGTGWGKGEGNKGSSAKEYSKL